MNQYWRLGGCGAAAERLDPGHEFGEGERLGQVIIGTQTEAVDPVTDRTRRGQHEHPGMAGTGGDLAADVVAMDPWQVAVEHHHVIGGPGQVIEGVLPVEGDVDGHALAAQSRRQGGRELGVVLGQ
jgi:hypothetical protein